MKKWMIVIGVLVVIAILIFIVMRPPTEVRNIAGEIVTHSVPEGGTCRYDMGDCMCLPDGCLTCGEGNVCMKHS